MSKHDHEKSQAAPPPGLIDRVVQVLADNGELPETPLADARKIMGPHFDHMRKALPRRPRGCQP